MKRLDGKIAVVTGAAGGIGRATARAFAREGACVIVTDIDGVGAEAVASRIRADGGRASAVQHDVGEESSWRNAIQETQREFGGIDVLVNNAGIGMAKSLLDTTLSDWRAVQRVNVDGTFMGTRLGVEAMRPQPGRPRRCAGSIVNVSSVLGIVGLTDSAAYCASKGAVRLLTKAVALECATKGWNVRVNSVHPSFVWTPLVEGVMERVARYTGTRVEAQREGLIAMHPLGRLGTEDDVATSIVYLASEDAAFVTGTELVVDGGYTAR